MRSILRVVVPLLFGLIISNAGRAQDLGNSLNRVYKDETHCLGSEMRGEKDKPISCYCRDALTDARYVYQTYLLSRKDENLTGTYLTLERNATEMCGDGYDVISKTREKDWRWNGPEVIRKYPPDREIGQIKPDKNGFRNVLYEVHLTYRDPQGRVTNVESFKAVDRLPPDFRNLGCPPSAICPK